MALGRRPRNAFTVDMLLQAYACGVFPMAASATSRELYLQDPPWRGIIPLDAVEVPRRLARTIRTTPYEVHIDTDFDGVIAGCAAARPGRESTWINREIRSLYGTLFERDLCHTVEIWHQGRLVGGLYGVGLRGAFFGESMFSEARDASKIALVHLCARLISGGFSLLDTQFVTPHLAQFGAVEVARAVFQEQLAEALTMEADFHALDTAATPDTILAIIEAAAAD